MLFQIEKNFQKSKNFAMVLRWFFLIFYYSTTKEYNIGS